jgi:hypothetical protein
MPSRFRQLQHRAAAFCRGSASPSSCLEIATLTSHPTMILGDITFVE